MKASSKVGSVEIVGEAIQIKRHQMFGAPVETRVLKIDHLTGIEFRRAGIEPGYLKIVHPGSTSSSSTLAIKAYDQDVIRFEAKDEADFLAIRAKLMERITGVPFVDDSSKSSGCIGGPAVAILAAVGTSIAILVTKFA